MMGNQCICWQARLLNWPSLTVAYTSPYIYSSGSPQSFDNSAVTPGWYVLEVRSMNECGNGEWVGYEVEYVDCSMLSGGGEYFSLSVSPNPADDDVQVKIVKEKPEVKALSKTENVQFILTDFSRSYIVKQWTFKNDQSQYKLNIKGIMPGQYVLTVIKGKYKESKQIIIK